jgi:integral membrane protein (TIGR01906 family)
MKGNKFAAAAAFFLLTLAAMLTVVDVLCFDRGFYTKEYAKNGTAEYMQMSEEDLEHTTDVLLAYLKDERDDLYVKAVVDGTEREVFDQREKLHMIDVKALYQNAMTFRTAAAVIGAVLLCAVLYGHEKKRELLKFGFQAGVILILALISALAVWAAIDFNAFWIQFHEVFFDNDLYLLDPRTELLIRMVPEQFFYDLVMRIVIGFFGVLAVTAGLIWFLPVRKTA